MIKLIEGPNFSGRSTALRSAVDVMRNIHGETVAYIGPEVFTSFSGLAATLEVELDLLDERRAQSVVSTLGIQHLLDRNLSSLSGGEEVLCAIAAGLVCHPELLALDCVLEQLDLQRRRQAIDTLKQTDSHDVLIADNRSTEWLDESVTVESVSSHHNTTAKSINANNDPVSVGRFDAINGDSILPRRFDDPTTIVTSGLSHRYRNGPWILNEVTLQLSPGTIIHLAGENGAGKSTFAKALVGALVPTGGSIRFNDLSNPWKNPGRVVSYHFQNPDMQLFRDSVHAELKAGANVNGRSMDAVNELVDCTSAMFGLSEVMAVHPLELPYSMRKRVALAATFACGKPWIILDEPTLGQDESTVNQLASILRRLSEAGTGIIVISHSPAFIGKMPHKRLTVIGGKIEF